MIRYFEILNNDGSPNLEMTKDIPSGVEDLTGAAAAFLEKRNLLKEVPTPDETEVKLVNPVTDEEFWMVSVQQRAAEEATATE